MEYLKAWIFLQYKLKDNGEEVDEILLKYVEQIFDNLSELVNTKFVERTSDGNFKVAELASLQVENRELKKELMIAQELLVNSQAFVSSMRLDHYENIKTRFIKRNENVEIQN